MKNMFKITLVVICCGFFLTCHASGDDEIKCIEKKEFVIGGVSYDFSKEQIIAIKGEPDSIKVDKDLNLEILSYPDMDIQVSNNSFLYLVTKSSENVTPNGVSTGMTKVDVMKAIGANNYSDKNSEFQFVSCEDEFYMVFKFDENNILTSLGIGLDLP